ncbi:MAG TPA: hypothetical protein VJ853_05240 [Thermoanaerobaculia bacterium]|nr:hypothetical protein [Thermoanaerobaculia bacterium]
MKTLARATCAAALVFASCSLRLPWSNEPIGDEVNVVFIIKNNLLFLPSITLDGHAGRFILGSANPQTVVDSKFAQSAHSLQLNQRQSVTISPVADDLHGVADAIIGADAWGKNAITIDYHAGLLTLQKYGIKPDMMTVFTYSDAPMINVIVDGRTIPVAVDTASPDTLTLRSAGTTPGRRNAHVQIAGTDFGNVDVDYADVTTPRIGNRLLSRFLVTIDYGRRVVGLWRDPRTAL